MMRRAILAAFILSTPLLRAQDATAPADPALAAAEQAMTASLPEVAIVKLNTFLASNAALDDTLRERAERDLTRAMLDSGDAAGALARLDFPSGDDERFWKAEALSALGRWEEAAPLYAEVAGNGPSPLVEPATLGQAEALHAVGRWDDAIALLARYESATGSTLAGLRLAELYLEDGQIDPARELLAHSNPSGPLQTHWRQYIEGRLYLAEDQAAPALQDFEELLKDPSYLTPALHAGATLGLTEARIVLNGLESADDVIEFYISHYPQSPYLEEMFKRLDAIYAGEANPSDSELQHWAAEAPPERTALALYYEGRSLQHQGRQEKAIRAYTEFEVRFPTHKFAFEGWMQTGELYLETGRIPTAIQAFEGAMRASGSPLERARAEIATGNAYFSQGEFLLAAETFSDAASRSDDLWLRATFDSALAWLHVGNYDRFLEDYNALSQRYPETDERRDLLLEEGLLQARSGDPRATATLDSFVRDFPDNRRVSEARIALAELGFANGDMDTASQWLQAAYVSDPSPQSREQGDYLAIFIADSATNRQDDEVLQLGRKFLDTYPNSGLRSQVRMKMGEVYFRREDFANAETQFETLAQESPADPLADKALILAGQSAVRSMGGGIDHALDLFDRVAKGTGPLKLYARQEQALLETRRGNDKGAIVIYDDILRSNPDTELRFAALCGKADCLVSTGTDAPASLAPSPAPSATGTDNFTAALALYDQVANDPDATAPWRDQALYKKGRCLDKQGLFVPALETYYEVLNGRPGAAQDQPDFFWFEKAGYAAAALLEARSQWPGAISILEKVAQAGGPRSAEARKRADQLRLDHFVWD